jgi:hypothetical protein
LHCIGFAKWVEPTGPNDKGWRGDRELHALSQKIRGEVRNILIEPHASAIVFFNPFNLLNKGKVVYIPLDGSKLSQEDYYKKGLDMITESVRGSRGADLESVTTEFGIDNRLSSLSRTLVSKKLDGIATAIFDRAIGPFLSRAFTFLPR